MEHIEDAPLSQPAVDLIAERFALLAEPMRIKILDHLHRCDEASVQEVAVGLGASHATVSRHLNLLHRAAIVGRRRDGPRVQYRITDPAVLHLCREVCRGLSERHPGLDIQATQQAQEAAA